MRPYILQSTIFKYPYPFFGSEMTRRHQNLLARSWRLGDHPARFNSLRNLWPTNVGACLCSPHPHPNKHLFWQPSEAKLSSCPPIWLPFSLPSSFNTFIYWISLFLCLHSTYSNWSWDCCGLSDLWVLLGSSWVPETWKHWFRSLFGLRSNEMFHWW